MAHFYGQLSGKAKTTATRCGTKQSGIQVTVSGWTQIVAVSAWYDKEEKCDRFRIIVRNRVAGEATTIEPEPVKTG